MKYDRELMKTYKPIIPKKDTIDLNYNQVMALMIKLDEVDTDKASQEIIEQFKTYVVKRSEQSSVAYPDVQLKDIRNSKGFHISKSIFKYLTSLTGINPLDDETMKMYIPLIQEIEVNAKEKFEEGFKRK